MARVGKIARLPDDIREVINRRLKDGHPAKDIVAWLNEQPTVKAVLEKEFDGEPITEVNMTAWKSGGYVEWDEDHAPPMRAHRIAPFLNGINAVKRIAPPFLADDISLFLAAR